MTESKKILTTPISDKQESSIIERLLPIVSKNSGIDEKFDPYKVIKFLKVQFQLEEEKCHEVTNELIRNLIAHNPQEAICCEKDIHKIRSPYKIAPSLLKETIMNILIQRQYYKYNLPSVHTSKDTIVDYNPMLIIDSLIKETDLREDLGIKVANILTKRLRYAQISFLSAPHIREMACSILTEFKLEEQRRKYTRIGFALADYLKLRESDRSEEEKMRIIKERLDFEADSLSNKRIG